MAGSAATDGDHVERDGLDGGPAIAAVTAVTAHRRLGCEGIEVHTHDGVDRVDQRDRVGPAPDRRAADGGHVADVRRELDHHGDRRDLLDPFGDHAGVVGHLADRRAHAALAHAMRTAEVQLDAVRTGVLRLLGDLVPGFAGRLDHQRDEERPIGMGLLDPRDLLEIHLERAIGDQFDIIESHHFSSVVIDGAVARRDVDDRLARQRLPDRATPAGVERATDLVFGVGRRTGCQPERVRRLDAAEFDRQVGHWSLPSVFQFFR